MYYMSALGGRCMDGINLGIQSGVVQSRSRLQDNQEDSRVLGVVIYGFDMSSI